MKRSRRTHKDGEMPELRHLPVFTIRWLFSSYAQSMGASA